jgi:serine/threonine protein kinase
VDHPLTNSSVVSELQLDALADHYLDQLRAGTAPDREKLVAEYPLLAERLKKRLALFDALDALRHARDGDSLPQTQPQHDPTILNLLDRPECTGEIGTLGRYRILELLGSGAMGCVFKARHPVMERVVAIKVILPIHLGFPSSTERFEREVKAASRLHHPNIVTAFDADRSGNTHFLVMEYVAGTDLATLLSQQQRLDVHQACGYIRQAASGLQHAHEQRMVHRDLKPSNLIVTDQGLVKILDFGLARILDEIVADAVEPEKLQVDTALESLEPGNPNRFRGFTTDIHTLLGTLDYMSPEQLADPHSVDQRSDIYSLGATLYHLLSGCVLFSASSTEEKLQRRLSGDPVPLNKLRHELDADLVRVVQRMLAKCREDRFQTAAQVVEALRPFEIIACPSLDLVRTATGKTDQVTVSENRDLA